MLTYYIKIEAYICLSGAVLYLIMYSAENVTGKSGLL